MNTPLPGRPLGVPAATLAIDIPLVSALVAEHYPMAAKLPVSRLAEGWDTILFRLGDSLIVRLPRREEGARLMRHEQRWLAHLAPQLPLPIPVPLYRGMPSRRFPWPWSIVPWLSGTTADQQPPQRDQTLVFARFLHALHQAAPDHAPVNPHRGVPLRHRAETVERLLDHLATTTSLITPTLRACWAAALEAPIDTHPTWIHGDLHPQNIVVHQGMLGGILDWGDLTAGDRATDLAAIWMVFADPSERRAVWDAYPRVSDATKARAKGWAIVFGTILLANGLVDHPRHAHVGACTLQRILDDAMGAAPA